MLFVTSILMILGIFAVGYPLVRWNAKLKPSFEAYGIIFGLGLLIGYALGLLTPSIHKLILILSLAIPISIWSLISDTKKQGQIFWKEFDTGGFFFFGLIVLALTVKVLAEPLEIFDARSIWYFHAKSLYFSDHMLDENLWKSPALARAHVSYPKLNAFWASAWMSNFPSWNEYLPKFSLVFMQIPALLFLIGFSKSFKTRCFLFAILFLNMHRFLWIGYMDGFVATYAGLGLLYGMRYIRDGVKEDLLSLFVIGGISCGLKNEGATIAVCLIGVIFIGRWVENCYLSKSIVKPFQRFDLSTIFIGVSAFIGSFIWLVWKFFAKISTDLASSPNLFGRLGARVKDRSSTDLILDGLFPIEGILLLKTFVVIAIAFWIFNWRRNIRYRIATLSAISIAVIYFCILMLAYLTTPHDLNWHLETSIDRVRLALHALLTIALLGPIFMTKEH